MKFLDPASWFFSAEKTSLWLTPVQKNSQAVGCFSSGVPGWNRTNNSGLEVRSYIHLTTGT